MMLASIVLSITIMFISIKLTQLVYSGHPADVWPFLSLVITLGLLKLQTVLLRK